MAGNLFDLTGKYAYITGGTKGIGRAIAEAFADHGAIIALTGRNADDAERVAVAINNRVDRQAAFGFAADLADRQGLIASYDAAAARFGRIDVLVCNAAALPGIYGTAEDSPPEEYNRLLEWNITNNVALINHAATAMKARRDGVLLVTTSGSGLHPVENTVPYGVSKAGIGFFVRAVAAELAPYNVRINAVSPGMTRSDALEEQMRAAPDRIEKFLEQVPLRRFIEPKEIAAGMVFLASEGGKAVSGQTIAMEAGEFGTGVGWDRPV